MQGDRPAGHTADFVSNQFYYMTKLSVIIVAMKQKYITLYKATGVTVFCMVSMQQEKTVWI